MLHQLYPLFYFDLPSTPTLPRSFSMKFILILPSQSCEKTRFPAVFFLRFRPGETLFFCSFFYDFGAKRRKKSFLPLFFYAFSARNAEKNLWALVFGAKRRNNLWAHFLRTSAEIDFGHMLFYFFYIFTFCAVLGDYILAPFLRPW